MKSNDDVKALVLAAVKKAAKKAFFETNEYISKRIVPGQYHLYAGLGSVSMADIKEHIDSSIKTGTVTLKIAALVKDGTLLKKKSGKINLYCLPNTDYLTSN